MKVDITSTYQTELFLSLPNITSVEFKDAELGSGQYGSVYEVASINNIASLNNPKLVVKIFKDHSPNITNHLYNTTLSLQKAIKEANTKRKTQAKKTIDQYPALKGLPLVSFEGFSKGKNVKGYLCQFLDKNSYSPFEEIVENKTVRDAFKKDFKVKDRISLCLNLVEGFEILKECGYIHADLNPLNFFIDLKRKELVVIDYDSGAITTSSNSDPQTFGKMADSFWMSPQIISQQFVSNNSLIKVNFLDDIWSVTVAIHFLLTLQNPFCYLDKWTPNTIKDYTKNFKWANVTPTYSNFNKNNPQLINLFCNRIQQLLPKGIYDTFYQCFNDGILNPVQRPAYFHWTNVLKNNLDPIKIIGFKADSNSILKGDSVNLYWKIENASKVVLLPDNRDVTSISTVTLTPHSSVKYYLEAFDIYGGNQKTKVESVTVNPKPTFAIANSKTKILKGECFNFSYKASDYKQILLLDSNGNLVKDISNSLNYVSQPISINAKYFIKVIGKFGGEISHEIVVEAFEAPTIKDIKADCSEAVDSMQIGFEFTFTNAIKAELLCNSKMISDVTGKSSVKIVAENKSKIPASQKFQIAITGYTGSVIKADLPKGILVYPQPVIEEIKVSPENVILFPQQIILYHKPNLCEQVFLSDGVTSREIKPNESVKLNPSIDTTYTFTPIGKLGFKGQSKSISIEVCHPIEIKISADKKITLPTLPVKISWTSKHHSKIILEQGNVDVSNKSSHEVFIDKKTVITLTASNKKHSTKASIPVDVLQFDKPPLEHLLNIPKVEFRFPEAKNFRTSQKLFSTVREERVSEDLTNRVFPKIFSLFSDKFSPANLYFNKEMREKLFQKLKELNNQ
ncbi:MAG: protein kinase family protein [Bacteroidetes bacterium]|nr:protein kinase family protein [Bacteroidota bacterium]